MIVKIKTPREINLKNQFILSTLIPTNFLLSLMIVFHHSFTVDINYNGSFEWSSYGITVSIQRFMYNLSECAVPMFYFLSAYLFYRTFDGSWSQYKEKIKRRFFSLFIPYIIFCTFGYIKHLVATRTLGGANFIDWIQSLWICDTMPLWFIRELMALSLLAPVLYMLKQRPIISFFISIIIVVLISLGIVLYRSFVYWIPVYLMGSMLNNLDIDEIKNTFRDKTTRYSMTCLGVFYLIWSWYLPNGILTADMSTLQNLAFIMFRIATPFILLFVMFMMYQYKVKGRQFMRYSFFVYCMHFPVITILGIILERLIGSSWSIELVKYFLIVFSSYSICVIVAIALQTYMPRLWYILNGSR